MYVGSTAIQVAIQKKLLNPNDAVYISVKPSRGRPKERDIDPCQPPSLSQGPPRKVGPALVFDPPIKRLPTTTDPPIQRRPTTIDPPIKRKPGRPPKQPPPSLPPGSPPQPKRKVGRHKKQLYF